MEHFEKLGSFYLGRPYDLKTGQGQEGYLLYDAKDLTTHAVCVGMTGSGKTGLCISLLEEAAIDGIPAIIIDPKGDMANLMLTFPDLAAADFEPWVNPDDAARKGLSVANYAAQQAAFWTKGLAAWGEDGERIRRMRANCEFVVYTPGSNAGLPVSVLQSFQVPDAAVMKDPELLQDQVSGTAASLLSLLGLDADPIRSREHILVSNILHQSWQKGESLELADLIRLVQQPPFNQIGVMELDSFYPAKDRFSLALQFNNLLASPGFASWMTGEPLDIGRFLHDETGKPQLSIFSIAHLSDTERMFFVSLLLNRVVGWMRGQSGTTSLRAIIYMDEIFGFFPPVANPPSKKPLLTLLKQARAYGVGVVLTTQNPVDLDYKGLSNTGTWWIGRLQTDRDKQRVLDGLEGASVTQGAGFNRAEIDKTLSALSSRVFLMHNVHEDEPVVFETRWAMSYLRGPLVRSEIARLQPQRVQTDRTEPAPVVAAPVVPVAAAPAAPRPTVATVAAPPTSAADVRAQVPGNVRQFFLPLRSRADSIVYQPALLGIASVEYRDSKSGFSTREQKVAWTPLTDGVNPADWDRAEELTLDPDDLEKEPHAEAAFGELPQPATQARSYTGWNRDFANWVYRSSELVLLQSPARKMTSRPGESERDFQIRLQESTREARDKELDMLKRKYATKLKSAEERVRKAELAVDREAEQAKQAKMNTAISLGATVLSAFVGRKKVSLSSLGRATTTVRSAGRTIKENKDIDRQKENVAAYQEELERLQAEFQAESDLIGEKYDPTRLELVEYKLQPAKKDIHARDVLVLWMPHRENGSPAW